jgi:hypothetical protein
MANLTVVIRVNGAPPLAVKGRVETVRDLGRLFGKVQANIRGTDRFLRGYAQGKVSSVTVRPE